MAVCTSYRHGVTPAAPDQWGNGPPSSSPSGASLGGPWSGGSRTRSISTIIVQETRVTGVDTVYGETIPCQSVEQLSGLRLRIREFIDRVLTAGEIDATGEYFHADVVEEVPLPR